MQLIIIHSFKVREPDRVSLSTKMAKSSKKSTPQVKPKAGVDPQTAAAELKKKLLKDKKSRAVGDGSPGPLVEVSNKEMRPGKTSAFVPHTVPQIPTQNSVDADPEDIADLIKSISSATRGNEAQEGRSSRIRKTPDLDAGDMAVSTDQPTVTTDSDGAGDADNDADMQTVGAKLSMLMAEDRDLRDWLLYTQYNDIEARNKKLARYRALVEVEAAEQRIKEEQERLAAARRKLLEEDHLERGFLARSTGAGYSQTPRPLVSPATPTTTTSSVSSAEPVIESNRNHTSLTASAVQKRRLDSDEAQDQASKIAKLDFEAIEGNRPTRAVVEARPIPSATDSSEEMFIETTKDMEDEVAENLQTEVAKVSKLSDAVDVAPLGDRERGRDHDRGPPGYPPHSHSLHDSRPPHRRSPLAEYGEDHYDERRHTYDRQDAGQYGSYRDNGKIGGWGRSPSPYGRHGPPPAPAMEPKRVDLGGKGKTRFFIVKSFNEENVAMCMEDGLWMTQVRHTETLTNAFAHCRNVILFFSVNKSRAFQGYARMTTAPSIHTPRPRWARDLQWPASPPFRLEWLGTTAVEFFHIHHLNNPLNEDRPVLIGKDGQEIEEECGRKLLEEMERFSRSRNEQPYRDPHPESPHATRGRGGFAIRGRGGRYIKQEQR